MVLRRRSSTPDGTTSAALDACLRLDALMAQAQEVLGSTATVLAPHEHAAATGELAAVVDAVCGPRHRFAALLEAAPPNSRLASQSLDQYSDALRELELAVTAAEAGLGAQQRWAALPRTVAQLASEVDMTLNMARQACTAARQWGADTAEWERQLNRASTAQAAAQARAGQGALDEARLALTALVAQLTAITDAASDAPAAAAQVRAEQAQVEERLDRVRSLGQSAVLAAEAGTADPELVRCGGALFAQALSTMNDSGASSRVCDLLEEAERQLTAALASDHPDDHPDGHPDGHDDGGQEDRQDDAAPGPRREASASILPAEAPGAVTLADAPMAPDPLAALARMEAVVARVRSAANADSERSNGAGEPPSAS